MRIAAAASPSTCVLADCCVVVSKPAAPAKQSSITAVSAPCPAVVSAEFFATEEGKLVQQIFDAFNKDGDDVLNQAEYHAFCSKTEGTGCDDARWATHTKSLGADAAVGLKRGNFAKLYTETRFKKHYGRAQQDLQAAQSTEPHPDDALAAYQAQVGFGASPVPVLFSSPSNCRLGPTAD